MFKHHTVAVICCILGVLQICMGAIYTFNHSAPVSAQNMLSSGCIVCGIGMIVLSWPFFSKLKLTMFKQ